MWAINDMFGTGTRGFAIITVILSVSTYVVVFGLLHQSNQQQVIETIKTTLRLPWHQKRCTQQAEQMPQGNELSKGGEKDNRTKSGEGRNIPGKTDAPVGKKTKANFLPQFVRKKNQEKDHGIGAV